MRSCGPACHTSSTYCLAGPGPGFDCGGDPGGTAGLMFGVFGGIGFDDGGVGTVGGGLGIDGGEGGGGVF